MEATVHRRARATPDWRRKALGRSGEDLAIDVLREAGVEILDRNWRCRAGEIDIIGWEVDQAGATTLIFCEVKTRRGYTFGDPLEAITATKQRHLRLAARQYLHHLQAHQVAAPGDPLHFDQIRFDAIAIVHDGGAMPQVRYVQDVA